MKVSLWAAVSTLLWAVALIVMAVAWGLLAGGYPHAANLLGFTSIFACAVAATLTVRCYALRTHNLIRSLHQLDGLDVDERHGMRSL